MAIKVFVAGDVVPNHRTKPMFEAKQTEDLFGSMLPLINGAEIKVVNLEAPIIYGEQTAIRKSGPVLHSTKETAEVLKLAGFNLVTLANNHFRDQGDNGVRDTLDALDSQGIHHVGGGMNSGDAARIFYYQVNGGTVGIINACEHEFSIATASRGGSNGMDIIALYNSIVEAKEHADYIIVIIHGGIEMYQLPTPMMKRMYHFLIDAGADVVVNHHQHCFSGYEIYKSKLIFYGLGNFCFDWENRKDSLWNRGFAVTLSLGREIGYQIHPYLQCDALPIICLQDSNCYETDLERLNNIIADDSQLEDNFAALSRKKKRDFLYRMSPFDNHCIAALYRRGVPASLYSKHKLFIAKNLICCESHREILMEILNNETT